METFKSKEWLKVGEFTKKKVSKKVKYPLVRKKKKW